MSFAPPADLNGHVPTHTDVSNDATGDDAYAHRMRLSSQNINQPSPAEYPPTSQSLQDAIPPPPPPPTAIPTPGISAQPPPPPPPPPPSGQDPTLAPTISRAPVRYNLPAPPSEIPKSEAELENALVEEEMELDEPAEADAPRSTRPGQQGFAERLMSKYGWSKGSGLGASGSGIVNPLRVQVEKQKKKPDSEGGGFATPGGRGKILGGKKKGGVDAGSEVGKFGAMAEVVILKGMVDGMDLDAELEGEGDGGLMQEIGEECGEKVRGAIQCQCTSISG